MKTLRILNQSSHYNGTDKLIPSTWYIKDTKTVKYYNGETQKINLAKTASKLNALTDFDDIIAQSSLCEVRFGDYKCQLKSGEIYGQKYLDFESSQYLDLTDVIIYAILALRDIIDQSESKAIHSTYFDEGLPEGITSELLYGYDMSDEEIMTFGPYAEQFRKYNINGEVLYNIMSAIEPIFYGDMAQQFVIDDFEFYICRDLFGGLEVEAEEPDPEPNKQTYNYFQTSTDYVDLGLPSGNLWGACNIGAISPQENGLYFSWGDIDNAISFQNYNIFYYGEKNKYLKYNEDGKTTLELADDAAYAHVGMDWHIPSSADFGELTANTTKQTKTLNGVKGIEFTSIINGEKIFMPFTGYCDENGNIVKSSTYGQGDYWTNELATGWVGNTMATIFQVEQDGTYQNHTERQYGCTIRPVKTPVAVIPESEFVDLGFESGTLWSSKNLNADSITDGGKTYQWGELESDYYCDWKSYKFCNNNNNSALTKYNSRDKLLNIEAEDDIATQTLGEFYSIPTKTQCEELFNNTNKSIVTIDGVDCVKLTSKINGNYIYIPISGERIEETLKYVDECVMIWTSTIDASTNNRNNAYVLEFVKNNIINNTYATLNDCLFSDWRAYGYNIRPVRNRTRDVIVTFTDGTSKTYQYLNDITPNYDETEFELESYRKTVKSIVVSEGITSIGECAFEDCENLESVVLPSTLTEIKLYALANNFELKTITCYAPTPPTLGVQAIFNLNDVELRIPEGSDYSSWNIPDSWTIVYI